MPRRPHADRASAPAGARSEFQGTNGEPSRHPDPRPARTRAAILDAIERLGRTGSELTVAAIVTEAQISRSSFYSQFADLGDVAVQVMSEMADNALELDLELRGSEGGRFASTVVVTMLLAEMRCRRGLFTAAFGSTVSAESQHEMCLVLARSLQTSIERQLGPDFDAETVSIFLVGGMLAAARNWLRAGCEQPIPELQAQFMAALPEWMLADPVLPID